MKPILFNSEMVKAILGGRKTATRRCIKFLKGKNPSWTGYVKDSLMLYNGNNEPCCQKLPYQVGDILYVRETFAQVAKYTFWYRATPLKGCENILWRPSIHMPKEAARIFLKVTDVRVEKLKEITFEGIAEEGVNPRHFEDENGVNVKDFVNAYIHLWDSTIKKGDLHLYGWNANPWVLVIEFERCKKPESEGI